ncbi:MAG: C4-dicarboxylate ABC transporter substrate-binding protein, partial [Pseudomonadota bacterium]
MRLRPATTLAVVTTLFGSPALAEDVLSAVHAFPTSLIYTQSFLEFVDKVNERGDGIVRIDVRGGPEAIGMFQQPDAVRNGVVD